MASTAAHAAAHGLALTDRSFFGHPRGLSTLFFTEMWERFSYYGMRALLVLYLVNALDYQRADALALYGTYTGLVRFDGVRVTVFDSATTPGLMSSRVTSL